MAGLVAARERDGAVAVLALVRVAAVGGGCGRLVESHRQFRPLGRLVVGGCCGQEKVIRDGEGAAASAGALGSGAAGGQLV